MVRANVACFLCVAVVVLLSITRGTALKLRGPRLKKFGRATDGDPSKVDAIGQMVSGLNILKFSPWTQYNAGMNKDRIFDVTYEKQHVIGDKDKYLIPDGMVVNKAISCEMTGDTKTFHGEDSIMKSQQSTVNIEVSAGKGPVKGSLKNSDVVKALFSESKEKNTFFQMTKLLCEVFHVVIEDYAGPRFSESFVKAVLYLVNNPTSEAAIDFVENFGTHYTKQASLGGKFLMMFKSNEEQQKTLQSSSVDVKVGAEAAMWGATGAAEARSEKEKKAAEFYASHSEKFRQVSIGTQLPQGKTKDEIKANWIELVSKSDQLGRVASMEFVPISHLLQDRKLQDINAAMQHHGIGQKKLTVQELQQIHDLIESTLDKYCGTQGYENCNETAADYDLPDKINLTVEQTPDMGGPGSNSGSFSTGSGEAIAQRFGKKHITPDIRPTKVHCWNHDHDGYGTLAGFQVEYRDAEGNVVLSDPTLDATRNPGGFSYEIPISYDNPITKVELYWGNHIDAIRMTDSKGEVHVCGHTPGTVKGYKIFNFAGFAGGKNEYFFGFSGMPMGKYPWAPGLLGILHTRD